MPAGEDIRRRGVSDDRVLQLFRDAQKELLGIIENMKSSRFSMFRRRQLLAIDRVILRLEKKTFQWAEEAVPTIFEAGVKETYDKIKGFDEKEFRVAFAGVDQEAVKSLVQGAWLDFGTTMQGLQRDSKRAALERRRMQERVLKGFIQGASAQRTQEELVRDLKRKGFTVLRAKNGFGQRFSLEHYSNLLVRTQNITAYSLGIKSQLLSSGRRYAIIPTIRPDIDGDDICNDWERKKYVDMLTDPLPPYHPNCRHTPQPVSFEQLRAERPNLYAKAVRYYRDTTA